MVAVQLQVELEGLAGGEVSLLNLPASTLNHHEQSRPSINYSPSHHCRKTDSDALLIRLHVEEAFHTLQSMTTDAAWSIHDSPS